MLGNVGCPAVVGNSSPFHSQGLWQRFFCRSICFLYAFIFPPSKRTYHFWIIKIWGKTGYNKHYFWAFSQHNLKRIKFMLILCAAIRFFARFLLESIWQMGWKHVHNLRVKNLSLSFFYGSEVLASCSSHYPIQGDYYWFRIRVLIRNGCSARWPNPRGWKEEGWWNSETAKREDISPIELVHISAHPQRQMMSLLSYIMLISRRDLYVCLFCPWCH